MCATDAQIAAELNEITDDATDLIATVASRAAKPTPWLFRNDLSRLVVDPERFPDEREELAAVGRGAVYTSLADGNPLRNPGSFTAADSAELMERFFHPYAAAMAEVTGARLAATGRALIIDVHSYPRFKSAYELSDGPRPDICIGADDTHTPEWLLDAAVEVFRAAGFEVGVNSPFAGTYIPLPFYGDARVSGLMVEIRKDVYLDYPGVTNAGYAGAPAASSSHPGTAIARTTTPMARPDAIEKIGRCIAALV